MGRPCDASLAMLCLSELSPFVASDQASEETFLEHFHPLAVSLLVHACDGGAEEVRAAAREALARILPIMFKEEKEKYEVRIKVGDLMPIGVPGLL